MFSTSSPTYPASVKRGGIGYCKRHVQAVEPGFPRASVLPLPVGPNEQYVALYQAPRHLDLCRVAQTLVMVVHGDGEHLLGTVVAQSRNHQEFAFISCGTGR